MHKVDLHTHSVGSPDGSLTEKDYQRILDAGRLDSIAITDHNSIAFAQKLHAKLGSRIIVGEEIMTREGEIIGLYLTERVKPGLSAAETVAVIKQQGGLVYIPHPFETVRKGITLGTLETIAKDVDIVEAHNGRALFQNRSKEAEAWAIEHNLPGAASSDAHGWHGWGRTYSIVEDAPTRANITKLLASAAHQVGLPGIRGLLYPKFNRIRRKR